eukprot:2811672-Rhodomonas_salina.3
MGRSMKPQPIAKRCGNVAEKSSFGNNLGVAGAGRGDDLRGCEHVKQTTTPLGIRRIVVVVQ